MKGMAGLLRPAGGLIRPAGLAGGVIAYLPQPAEIEKRFPISVIQTVLLGHWRRIGSARPVTGSCARERSELSGGRSRRFRAAAYRDSIRRPVPACPFRTIDRARCRADFAGRALGGVDWRTSEDLLRFIVGWQREGRTVLPYCTISIRFVPISRIPCCSRASASLPGKNAGGADAAKSAAGSPHLRDLVGRRRKSPGRSGATFGSGRGCPVTPTL